MGDLKKSIDKNALFGGGGRSFKSNKNKSKKTKDDEKPDKKIIFLVHKKPLNAACYDRCRLICLILMFFVFCWGRLGSGDGGFGGPLPRGLGPSPTPLRSPQLGFQREDPRLSLTLLARPGRWSRRGRGLDAETPPLAPGWGGWSGCRWQCQGLGP